ncbi:GDP-L-fucose synthase [Gammaproteobacteria bacterium]|nr:GDP-L-fucose synthase [Gammaproteobacteria bacterium]
MDTKNRFNLKFDLEAKSSRIFIAGHNGLVGRAILECLKANGFTNLVVAEKSQLDLLNQDHVLDFFKNERLDQVYLAAAKVGGIFANSSYPADFIYQNLMIQNNIINAAYLNQVERLLFLGSSCIYPISANQPMKESELLSGPLEKTNEAYAIAKIAGIEMCKSFNQQFKTDFRCVMPTNLYGCNDNFQLKSSHVIPALISKFYDAKKNNDKKVEIWGTGKPRREFLHVKDLASACIFLMGLEKEKFFSSLNSNFQHINIGSGEEVTIKELAKIISKISNFDGELAFNQDMPDGARRKLLDISIINRLGWKSSISLEDGIRETYQWFEENQMLARNQQ